MIDGRSCSAKNTNISLHNSRLPPSLLYSSAQEFTLARSVRKQELCSDTLTLKQNRTKVTVPSAKPYVSTSSS